MPGRSQSRIRAAVRDRGSLRSAQDRSTPPPVSPGFSPEGRSLERDIVVLGRLREEFAHGFMHLYRAASSQAIEWSAVGRGGSGPVGGAGRPPRRRVRVARVRARRGPWFGAARGGGGGPRLVRGYAATSDSIPVRSPRAGSPPGSWSFRSAPTAARWASTAARSSALTLRPLMRAAASMASTVSEGARKPILGLCATVGRTLARSAQESADLQGVCEPRFESPRRNPCLVAAFRSAEREVSGERAQHASRSTGRRGQAATLRDRSGRRIGEPAFASALHGIGEPAFASALHGNQQSVLSSPDSRCQAKAAVVLATCGIDTACLSRRWIVTSSPSLPLRCGWMEPSPRSRVARP